MFEPQEFFSLSFYELFLGRSMNIFLFVIFPCVNIFLVLRPPPCPPPPFISFLMVRPLRGSILRCHDIIKK